MEFGIFSPKPILGDWGVKGYVARNKLKNKLGNLYSEENLEIAKMLCFEAICLGITSKPTEQRKYKCLDKFVEIYPDIVSKIFASHTEYFVDEEMLRYCNDRGYIDDSEEVESFIQSLDEMFPKEKDIEDHTNEEQSSKFPDIDSTQEVAEVNIAGDECVAEL